MCKLPTHLDGEFTQSGAIRNIGKYLLTTTLVAEESRVFSYFPIVVCAALLEGCTYVGFRKFSAVRAFEVAELGTLAEVRNGRGMCQGNQPIQHNRFEVK